MVPAMLRVRLATWVVCLVLGEPDLVKPLLEICERESRCQPIGVHNVDAHLSWRGYHGQVGLGHLDPDCQPYEPRGWATRGPWGLSAASHWEYLPRCYSPAALDVPIVSAWVAARAYQRRCRGKPKASWCG
jgi:hypothetical protein